MSFNKNESALMNVIDAFTSGEIAAPDFEKKYSVAWRIYRDSLEAQSADIFTQRFFDSVFSVIDCYCSDPELIDEDDLNDDELLNEVSGLKASWGKRLT